MNWLSDLDIEKINKIRQHLANLHDVWQKKDDEHYCKSNEGNIQVIIDFPNWFDCNTNKEEYLNTRPNIRIYVYSYLFGPHRGHDFCNIDEALNEVLTWKTFDYE